jgi:hypothetical protein
MSLESNCCGASPLWETDLCSDCKEHAEFEEDDLRNSIKCSKCRVNNQQPSHSCPFAEEINNDSSSLCDCCSDCEHECYMDI